MLISWLGFSFYVPNSSKDSVNKIISLFELIVFMRDNTLNLFKQGLELPLNKVVFFYNLLTCSGEDGTPPINNAPSRA